ncbi:MAG: DNA replication and repair protein RecF [Sphaerochaetaceae bacterium]|nr:DNA replication and repair protein RecF [Sphaerochaetaceae bacterium]
MKFLSVGFKHFRNLEDTLIPTDAKKILLVGKNGQGKTNFLEALYTLCYGSSFRTNVSAIMCKHGHDNFSLSAVAESDDSLHQTIFFSFTPSKREIRIDGKEIRDRKELMYNIPCIVFSHDDIEFVRGTPENRRRFFDQTMSMYDPLFFDDLRRYKSILKQRNAAIKENYIQILPLYNQQIAEVGIRIQQQRKAMVDEFNEIFPDLYNDVSDSSSLIHIRYRPSWRKCETKEDIVERLEENLDRDIRMQTTVTGIHRDQFVMMDDHVQFTHKGSTGQLRLASLIFRIAQMHTDRKKTGKNPVLLIDDVLLELDITTRGRFLQQLTGYEQAFFTFLPDEQYFLASGTDDRIVYDIDEGKCVEHG